MADLTKIIADDGLALAGNATPVKTPVTVPTTVVYGVTSEPEIFTSGGLGAATAPQPYIPPIKPLVYDPDLTFGNVIVSSEDQIMPKIEAPKPVAALPQLQMEQMIQASQNMAQQISEVQQTVPGIDPVQAKQIAFLADQNPDLTIPEIVEVIQNPEPEQTVIEEPPAPVKVKKIGLLDKVTNYIYNFLFYK